MADNHQTASAQAPAGGGQSGRERHGMEEESKKKKELKELLNAFIDGDLQTPPLCTAATKGSVGLVTMLLDKFKADKNCKDNVGETPLMKAADNDHLPVVEALLAAGVDVNITTSESISALHIAATKGFDGIADALLKNGASKNALDNTGGTPLMEAAYFGRLPVVKTLLAKHADVNITDAKGSTALIGAAQEGHEKIVDALLDKGAGMNASNNEGYTALHVASGTTGHLPVVTTLLIAGANVDISCNDGHTALHAAAGNGHHEVARALLRAGVDKDARTSKGITALHLAAWFGHNEVVITLLGKGADKDALQDSHQPPLFFAASEGHLPVVKTLMEAGADVNIRTPGGATALSVAASKDQWPVVELLLEAGADPRVGGSCFSPLHFAVRGGQVRIAKEILKRGDGDRSRCDVDLYEVAEEDQGDIIVAFIEAGVASDINSIGRAFGSACGSARVNSMLALLQHGADMTRALHIVCRMSSANAEAAVSLLLRWGADETALDDNGNTPAAVLTPNKQMLSMSKLKREPLSQDGVDRVRLLLARAPADRTWRRRGWLVMLRSRTLKAGGDGGDGGAAGARSVKQRGGAGGGKESFDLSAAVAQLGLIEEGVFRNVVGFL